MADNGFVKQVEAVFDAAPDRGWVRGVQTCSPDGVPYRPPFPVHPPNITYAPGIKVEHTTCEVTSAEHVRQAIAEWGDDRDEASSRARARALCRERC